MTRGWRAALWTGVTLAVPAVINAAIARHRRVLKNVLPGEQGEYDWPLGRISYQTQGEGAPVVLLHGIGAGASSFEWRNNVEALSAQFRVYTLDWPGFGQSERRAVGYHADLYIAALMDFLRDVVGEPAHIVASSLSGAYAVRLAASHPDIIRSLSLICPTGLQNLRKRTPVLGGLAYGVFSLPAIGESLFNGIASYGYIDRFLREELYLDPARVTPALIERYYQSAHQPGGLYGVRAFVSGLLSCDIKNDYPRLTQPVMIAWGRHAHLSPAQYAEDFVAKNPRASLHIFARSRMLPHDEEADAFNTAVMTFLRDPENAVAATRLLPEPPEREASVLEPYFSEPSITRPIQQLH